MVNVFFTVVSLAVLVVAMVTKNTTTLAVPPEERQVLSATSQSSSIETVTPTPIVTPVASAIETAQASASATPSVTPKPTLSPTPHASSMNEWIYSGVVTDPSISDSSLSFTTTATPKEVTMWYKTKLKLLSYVINQDIESIANKQGVPLKTLNKVIAVKAGVTIMIEISQESPDTSVSVTATESIDSNNI